MKIYDIYFKLENTPFASIEAETQEEAIKELGEMEDWQILNYIRSALTYGGIEITKVEEYKEVE